MGDQIETSAWDEMPVGIEKKPFGLFLKITFLKTQRDFIFRVGTPASFTGVYEYLGESYERAGAFAAWQVLSGLRLSDRIFRELSETYTHFREPDFIQQVEDSFRVTQLIGASAPVLDSLQTFIDSEQSVTSGHPFHPSPKSRTGFSDAEVRSYSPEFGQSFQLHYFGAKRANVVQDSLLEKETLDLVSPGGVPQHLSMGHEARGDRDEFVPIPVHPWEAKYLLGLPEVQEGLRNHSLVDLGALGPPFFATSSVRTLYSPEQPFFYKMSLHVRVTNCIRRNALSEMRSAVELTRLLRGIRKAFAGQYPNFRWLEEPGFLSLCLTEGQEETEGFGMILRESLTPYLRGKELPLVSAALFGNQARGRHYLSQFVRRAGMSEVAWFSRYLEVLLPPVLDLYFNYGLMSEPHLQNIVVCLTEGVPTQILLRDLDNFRLIQGGWGAENMAHSDFLQDLVFEKDEAWNRFVYCLIVNHLNETIYSLSRCGAVGPEKGITVEKTERLLWTCLKEHLKAYRDFHQGNKTEAGSRISGLLQRDGLPTKGNLVTRFRRAVDRNAVYFQIPNPLRSSSLTALAREGSGVHLNPS